MSRRPLNEAQEDDRFSESCNGINGAETDFDDFLPLMLEKLGPCQFVEELTKGFRLLVDRSSSTITQQSLQRNATLLGLRNMSEDDIGAMVKEGDLDGDGALNLHEFLLLMLRFSPRIMDTAHSIMLSSAF